MLFEPPPLSPATQRFNKPLAVGKKPEERVHLALIYSRRVKILGGERLPLKIPLPGKTECYLLTEGQREQS